MKFYDYIDKFIDLERKASNVYEKIKLNSPEKIANIAETFSKEELKHVEWLEGLKQSIPDNEVEINEEFYYISDFNFKSVDSKGSEFKVETEKDLFLFSLQMEKNSILMYSEFKNNFPTESDEYELFKRIIDEERSHMFLILKVLHDL